MRMWGRAVLGVGLGAALLWIALAQVDIAAAGAALLGADPRFLACGLGLYWLDIALRVARWRGLLQPTKPLTFAEVGQALVVGYAVNNVLPARLGEIFRADFLRRQFAVGRSAAVGSIIVERGLDGVIVVALFITGLGLVNLQASSTILQATALIALIGVFAVAVAVVALPSCYDRLPFFHVPWVKPRLTAFVQAISVVRTSALFPALVLSVVIWALECGAILMVIAACSVSLTLPELFLVVGASSLSTLLPSAPGYIGSLQIAYVLGFSALGHGAEAAVAAATLTQIILLGSITLAGLALFASVHLKAERVQ
jgi:uncharacterized protein (TIRG00374 family)